MQGNVVVWTLVALLSACARQYTGEENNFGTAPSRQPPSEEEGSSSSSGKVPAQDAGSSSSSGASGGDCTAPQTFALGPTFGTLNDDGGEAVISVGGTEMNVDAEESIDFERVIAIDKSECAFELGIDTKMFSTTSDGATELVWIDYDAGESEQGTLVLGGWSQTFADEDDMFELTLTRCPGGSCGVPTWGNALDVSEAMVVLRLPLAGGGQPAVLIDGDEHVDVDMKLPDTPISKLVVHVGHRSNDIAEGTITYESITLKVN